MQIDILTLFPKMFEGPFNESIVKRAQEKGLITINLHNLRQWAVNKRGSVDDRPYGGGAGMVIRVDVVDKALKAINSKSETRNPKQIRNSKSEIQNNENNILEDGGRRTEDRLQMDGRQQKTDKKQRIILLTPQGEVFTQEKARELSKLDRVILICGHYEGFDERIREHLVDEQLSIGEYVLTGGELPAMVVTDAITRLLPGVLVKEEATRFESFGEFPEAKLKVSVKNLKLKTKDEENSQPVTRNSKTKLLEYPQYTRPEEYNGWKVPEILLSGDHKRIEEWKKREVKS